MGGLLFNLYRYLLMPPLLNILSDISSVCFTPIAASSFPALMRASLNPAAILSNLLRAILVPRPMFAASFAKQSLVISQSLYTPPMLNDILSVPDLYIIVLTMS